MRFFGAPFLTDPILRKKGGRSSTPKAACALSSNLKLQSRASRRIAGKSKLILGLNPHSPWSLHSFSKVASIWKSTPPNLNALSSQSSWLAIAGFVVGDDLMRKGGEPHHALKATGGPAEDRSRTFQSCWWVFRKLCSDVIPSFFARFVLCAATHCFEVAMCVVRPFARQARRRRTQQPPTTNLAK